MALTLTEAGTANSTTSSATLVATLTTSFAAGDMIIVCTAADNAGSLGVNSISSVTDSKSHTYTSRSGNLRNPTARSNEGVSLRIHTAFVTTAMTTSDTVTVNFSPNTPSKAVVIWKATVASTEFPKFLGQGNTTGGTANPSQSTITITNGDGIIYALAAESNAALTGDSDTSNGSWSTLYTAVADTGTSLTSITVGSQNKVVTGTATQTWNTTLAAADWVVGYIILDAAAKIQRTATGSGTGTSTATPRRIRRRTATGSGTGSSVVVGAKTWKRTASASGVGTSTAVRVRVRTRTATSSGTGTSTTTIKTIDVRTATSSGTGSSTVASQYARVRTATGSGLGSETAVGDALGAATAAGLGTGSGTATRLVISLRTATALGTGTSATTKTVVRSRVGASSGAGSETATRLVTAKRTATAAGSGTSDATGKRFVFRTASATGTGTQILVGARVTRRMATASGIGSSTSTQVKLLLFRTPRRTERKVDRLDDNFSTNLFRYVDPILAGVNVYKLVDGTFTEVEQRDYDLVVKTYWGGSNNFVTQEEKDELIAAGYGDYVT